MSIGQTIKEFRTQKGMTQEELGNLVGLQKSAIAKYESGRVVNIKGGVLTKIAAALDMKMSELIFAEISKDLSDFRVKVMTDHTLLESLKDYYKLSPENQKIIRDLISSLVKEQ